MDFVGTHQFAYEFTAKEIIFQQTVKKKAKKKQAKKISSHLNDSAVNTVNKKGINLCKLSLYICIEQLL